MEVYTCDSVSYVICRNLAFLMLDLVTSLLSASFSNVVAECRRLSSAVNWRKKKRRNRPVECLFIPIF